MARLTLQQIYISGLQALGETQVKTTAKYRVFTATRYTSGNLIPADRTWFYYVGSSGAVRVGSTVAESRPISEQGKENLKQQHYARNA